MDLSIVKVSTPERTCKKCKRPLKQGEPVLMQDDGSEIRFPLYCPECGDAVVKEVINDHIDLLVDLRGTR